VRVERLQRPVRGSLVLAAAVALAGTLAITPALAAEGVDPEADKILRSMSSYLKGLSAFSMNADIDHEIMMNDGQKLQLSSSATLLFARPAQFSIKRKGMFADAEIRFDGKALTLYSKNLNVYLRKDIAGTIDDAIRTVEGETGLDAPGADLVFADPYAVLSSGTVSGEYVGTAFVAGVECHHLAFRKDKVDWQLWVQTGSAPLPMKYVITTKWMTGAPQYSVRLRDWNTNPQIQPDQFVFRAPSGAKEIQAIAVNDMGEITASGEASK